MRSAKPRNVEWAYLKQLSLTSLPLAVSDFAALVTTIGFCWLVGLQWLAPMDVDSRLIEWLIPVGSAFLLLNAVVGLYPGVRLGVVDEIRGFSVSAPVVALITIARLRFSSPLLADRVTFAVVACIVCIFLAPIFRSRVRGWLAKTSWWGFPTLVCGNDTAAFGVCEWMAANQRLGLRPVGVVADPHELELEDESPWFRGNWSEARQLAESNAAFWAVLVETGEIDHDVTSVVDKHLGSIPHVFVVSELTGMPNHWDRHQIEEGLTGFTIEQHLLLPIPRLMKRGLDLFIACTAGLILLPLLVVLAVAIKLTSEGPIFYGHKRVGRGNTRFLAWKFRTMVVDADKVIHEYLEKHPEYREEWDRDHKLKNDPRVNALGKFMRKWSIDELPQIWNVIRGDMGVVGPRPIVDAEIPKYAEHFETFSTVLPGMTGLWQVCGRNDTTYEERVQLDVYYVHHWSPWLDLYLLARTIKTVLFAKGAY